MKTTRSIQFFLKATNAALLVLLLGSLPARAIVANLTWTGSNGDGQWDSNGNWGTKAGFPDGVGSVANFTASSMSGNTISFGSDITISTLNINSSTRSYTFSSGVSTLSFSTTSSAAAINIAAGSAAQTINTTVLNNNAAGLIITQDSANTLTFGGVLAGSGNLLITTGTPSTSKNVVFSGITRAANLLTGTVTVDNGIILTLDKLSNLDAIAGNLVINSGGSVFLNRNNQINDSSTVTVNGALDLGGHNDTIAGLVMAGGSVTTGTGTLTLNGNATTNASATFSTISGNLALSSGTNHVFNTTSDLDVSALISGSSSTTLTKTGAGQLNISGSSANTFAGAVSVNAGTLLLNKSVANGAITGSSLTIHSGAIVQLGASNQIADTTALTLNGGTFTTKGGYSETLGTLSLTANSTISLNQGSAILTFSGTDAASWGSGILTIAGWDGNAQGGGAEQLLFASTSNLTGFGQLGQVRFFNPSGFAAGTYGAQLIGNEVVPIPEASHFAAFAFLFVLLGVRHKRKLLEIRSQEA